MRAVGAACVGGAGIAWFFLGAAAAGCGAREDLGREDGASSYGGGFAVGSGGGGDGATGAVGGGGGGGAGGTAPECVALQWAGDPVVVNPIPGGSAVRPRLVPVGGGETALVFDSPFGDSTLLSSAKVVAFGAWPPEVSTVDSNFPSPVGVTRFAVSTGAPGEFNFIVPQGIGMALGRAVPGENGSSFIEWRTAPGEGKLLARAADGRHVAGYGNGILLVDVLSGLEPEPTVETLGVTGCATPDVIGAAVATGGGGFLIANTTDNPFDDCLDPDVPGPPTFVQILRIDPDRVVDLTFFEATASIFDVQLVPRIGGGTLLFRTQASSKSDVIAFDDEGGVVLAPSIDLGVTHFDGIGAWFDGFAFAVAADDSGRSPILRLDLYRPGAPGVVASVVREDIAGTGRPAVLASGDGTSFLIAVEVGGGAIALARADCAALIP